MSDFSTSGDMLIKYTGKEACVVIPESIRYIGANAFAYNLDIQIVCLPSRLVSIGEKAFSSCRNLSWIDVNNSRSPLKEIRNEHYNILPDSLISIGKAAFDHCSSLWGKIVIPNGVTEICDGTFAWCSKLEEVGLPSTLTRIGNDAFQWCTSLYRFSGPSSLKTIGYSAFEFCESLYTVSIPMSIQNVGSMAFYGCNAVEGYTGPSVYESNFPKVLREKDFNKEKPILNCLMLSILALITSATIPVLPTILAIAVLKYMYKTIGHADYKANQLKAGKIVAVIAVIINVVRSLTFIAYTFGQ